MDLFVEEYGPKGAATLIFLHGGGAGAWMWGPVIERLPEFHCLAVDLPEHGRSMGVKPFTISGAAARVAGVIRDRAPEGKAHAIGLSLGAQVLVALLSQAPEALASALISSALVRPLPGARLGLYSAPLMVLSYWAFIAPFKKWDAWIRLNSRYAAGIPGRYFEQARQDFRATTRDSWVHVTTENQGFRLPGGLERAQVPALVIAGQKEYAAMRQSARDLLAVLPQARGVRVTHAEPWSLQEEHNWALKAPGLFADTVRAWVTGAPLPEALQPFE